MTTPPPPSSNDPTSPATEPNAPEAKAPDAAQQPAAEPQQDAGESAIPKADALPDDLAAQVDAAMAELGMGEDGGKGVNKGGGEGRRGGGGGRNQRRGPRPQQSGHAPLPNAPAAAIKGPRVVQAGREHRKGVVVSVGPTDVFIEFGPKELGVLQRTQWPDESELPKVGESAEVVVERFEPSESIYICSRPGAVTKADWEMLERGQAVEGVVVKAVKAGLELEIGGHRAFMPASQIDIGRVDNFEPYVGQKLECIVTQLDRRGRGNIVVSRRELLDQQRAEQASKLRDKLEEGETVEGIVRKVMDFGAFVDIGGVDGLIHISDLSHDRVGFGAKAVEKHVAPGDKVTVKILKLDWDNNRISLGLKQLQEDPFQSAAGDLNEGAQVTGKVTKIAEFGAFVEVAPGVEGLVHISEIAHKRVRKVEDELKEDQVVQVQILKIDPDSRKISLSIKATQEDPMAAQALKASTEVSPRLRRMREKFKNQALKGGF